MDKRIGAQLYTVRDYTKTLEDFDKTLEKVAAIGYKSVQLSAIGPFSGEDIKALLDKHHLVAACTHRGYDEYTQRLKESSGSIRLLTVRLQDLACSQSLAVILPWRM